jgi:hypothetical protein
MARRGKHRQAGLEQRRNGPADPEDDGDEPALICLQEALRAQATSADVSHEAAMRLSSMIHAAQEFGAKLAACIDTLDEDGAAAAREVLERL